MANRIVGGGLDRPLHTLSRGGRPVSKATVIPQCQRLSADTWQATDEPYLLLEVPARDITSLWAGFETAADDLVPRRHNPYAVIERYSDMIVLMLHGRGYWTPLPYPEWPQEGECQIFVVADGLLPRSGTEREPMLVDLINAGDVLVAVNPITELAPYPSSL